jgi:hypothetical protein
MNRKTILVMPMTELTCVILGINEQATQSQAGQAAAGRA